MKQIGDLFEKKLQEGLGQFWEGNLEPAFDTVYEKFDEVKDDLQVIEAVEQKLGITVSEPPVSQ